jgi:Phosphatidylglycerophosphate synthase
MHTRSESPASGFVSAPRIHTALTAGAERRLLVWIAQRTPAVINPDHLTALGFVSQLLAGAAYALASSNPHALWVVNGLLFLNWLGDSLDGTLARVRNRQRPRYGFYVDHIADTFGALALMAGLACSGYYIGPSRPECWRAFMSCRSRATWQPIRWDAFTCRTAFLVRPRFESCWPWETRWLHAPVCGDRGPLLSSV